MNITDAPPFYVLSKDPVYFSIDTGVTVQPTYTLAIVYPTNADGGGYSADIDVNGTIVPFTLPARGIGMSDLDYSLAIRAALMQNITIFYNAISIIVSPDTTITISTNIPISAAWVVSSAGWFLAWGTPTPSPMQQLAVWVLMGDPLEKVHQQPMLFPITAPQKINVSAVLTDNLLAHDWLPDIPECSQTTISENSITHQDFQIKYGLWENGQLQNINSSVVFRALYGGTGAWNDHINPHYPLLTLPASGLLARFLTHQPRKKTTTYVQPEFLTWFHHETLLTAFQVHVVAYNGDGTIAADFYPTNLLYSNAIVGHSYRIPVGAKSINLCNIYPDTVYYTVQVVDAFSLTPISEKMTYLLVSHTKNTRYYVFLNSLGGIDTISTNTRMIGTWENGRDIAVRSNSDTPNPSIYGQMFTYNADITRKYDLTSEFYDRCDVLWLQDLLLQNAWAAEWVQCKGCGCGCDDELECRYIPIIVEPKMSAPLHEFGKVRIDWGYREAATHGSYPVLGCDDSPIVAPLCEATFSPEVITFNYGGCFGNLNWGYILQGVISVNFHSTGLSPAATMQMYSHGEQGLYIPSTMPFNSNFSDNSFWIDSGQQPYSDLAIDQMYPYDVQCFWIAFVVFDGGCSYTLLFFLSKVEICSNPTPMYYGLFLDGQTIDPTAVNPIAIDTVPLCTECSPD